MKTIMIEDRVYRKLRSVKGTKSFSKLLDALVDESMNIKKARLRRYFGSISDEQAERMQYAIGEIRKNFRVRI